MVLFSLLTTMNEFTCLGMLYIIFYYAHVRSPNNIDGAILFTYNNDLIDLLRNALHLFYNAHVWSPNNCERY